MMWGFYDGSSWLWMGVAMLLFWCALFAMVVWAVRALARPGHTGDQALETLRRRLAAGEISQEDFEKTRKVLTG
jgi:uncharacterized membrane protein